MSVYCCLCGCNKFLILDGLFIACSDCEKRYELKLSNSVDHLIEKSDEFLERLFREKAIKDGV